MDLKIGENYGYVFGLKPEHKLIYIGGTQFRAVRGDKEAVFDSPDSLNKIKEYLSRPAVRVGVY